MPKKKTPGIPDMGNRPQYDAMFAKRTSGAAGTHAQGPKRERSRAAAKRAEIRRDAA